MAIDTTELGKTIAAIGGLGTAAFGLVDTLKLLPNGGISNVGFTLLERGLRPFTGGSDRKGSSGAERRLYDALHASWINGAPLADQKAIAKSLLKARLDATTAGAFAAATGVDPTILGEVGARMASGTALEDAHKNVLGRFDLALSAILDDLYQHADQRYRNASKVAATAIALVLGVVGGASLTTLAPGAFFSSAELLRALLAGLLATPLAPMAKDLASALQASAKAVQGLRR